MSKYASWLADEDGTYSVDLSSLPKLINYEAKRKLRSVVPSCAAGVKIFTRQCGHRQAVPIRCGKPTCPDCEPIRSAEAVYRWQPTIDAMAHPKMVVLAVQSDKVLEVAGRRLADCFARFMDLRIGGRKRGYYQSKTVEFITAHAAEFDNHHAEDPLRKNAAGWLESCEQFWTSDLSSLGKRKAHRHPGGLKVRDLLKGIRSLEITWSPFTGWHPHFHMAADGIFIPFPALLMLWMEACTVDGKSLAVFGDPDDELAQGECIGRTAHISALRKPQEVLKYVTKHFDGGPHGLPNDRKHELEAYLHGKKRVWPIGDVKPRPLEKPICPSCKDPACKCDHGEILSQQADDGIWSTVDGKYARIYRLPGLGLTWDEVTPSLDGKWLTAFSSHNGNCLTETLRQFLDGGP